MDLKEEINLYQKLLFEQDGRAKVSLESLSIEELEHLLSDLKKENKHLEEPDDLKDMFSKKSLLLIGFY